MYVGAGASAASSNSLEFTGKSRRRKSSVVKDSRVVCCEEYSAFTLAGKEEQGKPAEDVPSVRGASPPSSNISGQPSSPAAHAPTRLGALEDALGALTEEVHALQRQNKAQERENAILRGEIAALKYGEASPTLTCPPRKWHKAQPLALTTIGIDTTVHIASFLGANGIAGLAQTCKRFGKGHVRAGGQISSLAEELAGQVFDGSATDYEKSILAPQDNAIKLLHELELMRSPLCFKQLIGSADAIRYSQPEDKSVISILPLPSQWGSYVTAISDQVMRAGRHYASFPISVAEETTVTSNVDFGVIRPIKDWDKKGLSDFDPICYDVGHLNYRRRLLAEKTDDWGEDLHCCSYSSSDGKCFSVNWNDEDEGEEDDWLGDDWEGMERILMAGNHVVGLLLDLSKGTLSVFKDGRKLGVMKEGFTEDVYIFRNYVSQAAPRRLGRRNDGRESRAPSLWPLLVARWRRPWLIIEPTRPAEVPEPFGLRAIPMAIRPTLSIKLASATAIRAMAHRMSPACQGLGAVDNVTPMKPAAT
ncbi:hypothetical protein THAOC_10859 [Thalassiosira oceanica]|uniref:B30.2/SPRY domain-containing protein n=1 Tax=Thalassiosira oceanica TaxID=159749 RepID=K0SSQ8_THAOC|nr:hypothetical protein THAOC_10859 [Thalassiosira oceanica]|eukprot:EJK68014.1 hypothetical protein THAOC_10859 [Thalassiosira oceanica]